MINYQIPASAPRIPGIPWVYEKSTLLPLVQEGAYFCTQVCARDATTPTSIPVTTDAQACIEAGAALTPGKCKVNAL